MSSNQRFYIGYGVIVTREEMIKTLDVSILEDYHDIDSVPEFIEDVILENKDAIFLGLLLGGVREYSEIITPLTLEPSQKTETKEALQALGFDFGGKVGLVMVSVVG